MSDETQRAAEDLQAELGQRRLLLSADQLASLISPGVTCERELEHDGEKSWFFTINGVLNGSKISGALFADSCILVHAPTQAKAKDLAQRGLRHTIDLLHEEYSTRTAREITKPQDLIVVGGRRGEGVLPMTPRALEQRDTLSQMILDALKGKG